MNLNYFKKNKCIKCAKTAQWYYVPYKIGKKEVDKYWCDECISRGCSCNIIKYDHSKQFDEQDGEQYKDDQGRLFPCIEYEFLGKKGRSDFDYWLTGIYWNIYNYCNISVRFPKQYNKVIKFFKFKKDI